VSREAIELKPEEKLKLVEERRKAAESALWQLPGLSLTAQAFLLGAGLQHDTPGWAREIAGALGIAIVFVTLAVLAFQGVRMSIFGYWVDYQLRAIAEDRLVEDLKGTPFKLRPLQKMLRPRTKFRKAIFDPFVLWVVTLVLFFIADVIVFIMGV
jgi:hypothetical protein